MFDDILGPKKKNIKIKELKIKELPCMDDINKEINKKIINDLIEKAKERKVEKLWK